ncbi:MAG: YihY/virulence factor BrkB family protein [Gemmatimonadetes bacterium]|nr:YihY/virulence factor BrkB family protein [Gemmatimonadota bacterium]
MREYFDDDMPTYAAALSYDVFLALFPFLLFLLAVLSFLDLGSLFDRLLTVAGKVLPPVAFDRVTGVLGEIDRAEDGGLLSFGIISAVWIASAGLRSTMRALNQAYDIPEQRPAVKRYPISVLYTVALAVLITIATVLMAALPAMAGKAAVWLGVGSAAAWFWSWLRIPAAIVLVITAVSLIYHFGPNRSDRLRILTPGSVLAVGAWVIATLAFKAYVSQFARYSVIYGSVGAVIVLLLYLSMSASALLLGAELNSEILKRRTGTAGRVGEGS